jgi:hypothetical protein
MSVTMLTTSGLPLIISNGYLGEEDEFEDDATFSISKLPVFLVNGMRIGSSVGIGTFSMSERAVVEVDASWVREVDERVAWTRRLTSGEAASSASSLEDQDIIAMSC